MIAAADSYAAAQVECFHPLPSGMVLPAGSRFPWCSLDIEGSVDALRRSEGPAGGWSAWADYSQGHRPRRGGMEDQPAIWQSVVQVCRGIAADIDGYLARQRSEALKRRTSHPRLHS